MQFSSFLLAGAALAVANAAQFTMLPAQFVSVKVGTAFDLTWSNATGPVTILLKNGASSDLKTVQTITTGATGTSYSWTPESTLASGTYAFEIDDTSGPNYSVQFTLSGGVASSSSSSSGSSTTGSSSTSTGSSSTGSITSTSSSSSVTASSNLTLSTTSSKTSASKTSSSTGSTTSSTTAATSVNSASGFASPLAFVLLALAAIMTLN